MDHDDTPWLRRGRRGPGAGSDVGLVRTWAAAGPCPDECCLVPPPGAPSARPSYAPSRLRTEPTPAPAFLPWIATARPSDSRGLQKFWGGGLTSCPCVFPAFGELSCTPLVDTGQHGWYREVRTAVWSPAGLGFSPGLSSDWLRVLEHVI